MANNITKSVLAIGIKWLAALIAVYLAGGQVAAANEDTHRPCPEITADQIIDAAIGFYVSLGIETRELVSKGACNVVGWEPGTPCVNTSPYFSVNEFKKENPDCCRLLNKIPGDYSLNAQRHFRGEKHPRIFIVDMTFVRFDPHSGEPYEHHTQKIVDCYGNTAGQHFPSWK